MARGRAGGDPADGSRDYASLFVMRRQYIGLRIVAEEMVKVGKEGVYDMRY